MTREEYDQTRIIPERIEAVDRGKDLVAELAETIRRRLVIESPGDVDGFDNDLTKRWHSLYSYFAKYMLANTIDKETKKPSGIYIMSETSDGTVYTSANVFTGEDGKADINMIQFTMLNIIRGLAKIGIGKILEKMKVIE